MSAAAYGLAIPRTCGHAAQGWVPGREPFHCPAGHRSSSANESAGTLSLDPGDIAFFLPGMKPVTDAGTPMQAASASVPGPALLINKSDAASQSAMASTNPSGVTGTGQCVARSWRSNSRLRAGNDGHLGRHLRRGQTAGDGSGHRQHLANARATTSQQN